MHSALRRQTLADLLRRSAARTPDKTRDRLRRNALDLRRVRPRSCARLAAGLAAPGVAKGDARRHPRAQLARLRRVALRAGAARRGAGADQFHAQGRGGRLHPPHAGARMLATDTGLAATARAARALDTERRAIDLAALGGPERAAARHARLRRARSTCGDPPPEADLADGDLAQIVYTSGTESLPKGAMLTHDAVISQYVSCIVDAEIAGDDLTLHALPLYHCAQLDVFFGPSIYVGATNVITAKPTPDNLLPLIETSPHHLVLRAADGVDLAAALAAVRRRPIFRALRKGYYGASIMPVEVLRELARRLPEVRLWNLYGQTEIAPLATMLGARGSVAQARILRPRRAQRRDARRRRSICATWRPARSARSCIARRI